MIATEGFALFDTYKTVVKNAKDISPYVAESIMNIYGIIVKVDLSKYEGLTSKQIAKSVLLENGFKEKDIDPRLARYMEDLPYSYYNVAWSDRIDVTDGAKELLQEMEKKDVLIGIATGEGERVAKMRLDKAGIGMHFKVGAYGDDGVTFNEILAKGLRRIEEQGLQKEDGVLIVSDPISVSIGKIAGIRTVGAEAGGHSAKDLKAAGADLVVKSLKEKGKIIDLIFS
ncbi:MAG TPA: HAD hydrolase-like protein [Candidatus Saccharimonadales bacterium]|nr:HAD hydrolase-like protein [Candidatus Saccharimonadales bacterium]